MEFYFERRYDEINQDGTRESDLVIRAIAQLYPNAVWEKRREDAWRIVV